MRMTRLGDTEIETSILGFGCADLFREPGRARRRLLEVALDAGIRHFDVAPMYGLGLVEREVGRFARGRRDRIVIATKFGIAPTGAARALARVQGPVQRALAAMPALGERAGPPDGDPRSGALGSALYGSPGYGAEAARRSLERSLRELRTDHVDVLLLHDPRPGDVRSDDVREYLESARAAGLIRAWGVAGEPGPTVEAVSRLGPPVPVLQVRDDVFLRSLRAVPATAYRTAILFGVVGRALARILAHVRSDETVRRRWNDATGLDCSQPGEIAALLLRDGLRESAGLILFSTVRPGRIEAAARAADADPSTQPALDAFRALVAEEITAKAVAQ